MIHGSVFPLENMYRPWCAHVSCPISLVLCVSCVSCVSCRTNWRNFASRCESCLIVASCQIAAIMKTKNSNTVMQSKATRNKGLGFRIWSLGSRLPFPANVCDPSSRQIVATFLPANNMPKGITMPCGSGSLGNLAFAAGIRPKSTPPQDMPKNDFY